MNLLLALLRLCGGLFHSIAEGATQPCRLSRLSVLAWVDEASRANIPGGARAAQGKSQNSSLKCSHLPWVPH